MLNPMDFWQLLEKYKPFLKQNILIIVVGLLGLMLLGYGLIGLFASKDQSNGVVFESSDESESAGLEDKQITVDVEGAVVKPGVYKLNFDARIQDALIAAAGLSDEANREWVAKNMNLAQKVKDGAKIYVPSIGTTGVMGTTSITGDIEGSLININLATESELDSLPGVGPITAQKIIDNRPYNLPEDLLNKKVVSPTVFEKIKEKITY